MRYFICFLALASILAITSGEDDGVKISYSTKRSGSKIILTFPEKQFLIETKIKKNWYGALHACRDLGYDLATLEEEYEQDVIYKTLKEYEKWEPTWIGLTNLELNNTAIFNWVGTGEELKGYENWSPNNPDNHRGQENCVHVIHRKKEGWNTYPCQSKKQYVCSRPFKASRSANLESEENDESRVTIN